VGAIDSLVAAAGELATQFGITGWKNDEAKNAAAFAFKKCLSHREDGGEKAIEEEKIMEFVRAQLFLNKNRFETESGDNSRVFGDRYGLYRSGRYLIPAEVFNKYFCDGRDPREVARVLADNGFIDKKEEGGEVRYTERKQIDGARGRYYSVSKAIIDLGEEESSAENANASAKEEKGKTRSALANCELGGDLPF